MEIIPAIDLINGKCVRLTNGDYNTEKIYANDPLSIAKEFENYGITRLHLVDLDGAKNGRPINMHVLEKIALNTSLLIDYAGGIKDKNQLQNAFNSGAKWVSFGSMAVKDKKFVLEMIEQFGNDKIIIGADVKNNKIAISGWLEVSDISILDFIEFYYNNKVRNFICTDISKDGMLAGPSFALYSQILNLFIDINLIASGGVSSVNDIEQLSQNGLCGAIVGKAIYENRISLFDLENFIKKNSYVK